MANKKVRVTYGGINQDVAKSKMQSNLYYDANNVKLTPVEGQTFGALSNAYGNALVLKLPVVRIDGQSQTIIYGTKTIEYETDELNHIETTGEKQQIIGHIETTHGVILFSTDGLQDCIWNIPDLDADILDTELLYTRNMNFAVSNPIQAVFNYENELIQKVYWVDGINYLRFINIMQSEANGYDINLMELPVASVNSKSTIDISRPTVVDGGGGGTHTAGMIQYAYSLYNLNGAETSLSPLSDLFPLDKGDNQGGGAINEVVGAMPVVKIADIDKKYEYLKLYSAKYTEYNGTPAITLIYDGPIGNYNEFTFNDTGTHNLGSLGIAEFLFLGADPVKPSHIVTKNNMLFAANNISTAYKLDIDTRAYSYNEEGTEAIIHSNVVYTGVGDIPFAGDTIDVADGREIPEDFDAVNLNFDKYRYQHSGSSSPGDELIMDRVPYINDVYGIAPEVMFSGRGGNTSVTLDTICDPSNSTMKYTTVPILLDGTSGGRFRVTSTGEYRTAFSTLLDFDSSVMQRLRVVSIHGTIEVYSSDTSTTPLRTISMGKTTIDVGDVSFVVTLPVTAGEYLQANIELGYHYNNDTCPYQTEDAPEIDYYGNGPYQGPDETGDNASLQFDIDYDNYILAKVDVLEDTVELPFAGGVNISDGKFISNYTGTVNIDIDSQVNMNGTAINKGNYYSLGVVINGVRINSAPLHLTTAGISNQTFHIVANLIYGDVLELELVNTQKVATGEKRAALQDFHFTASGRTTIKSAVSAGSNGEGGTGININYELTRTDRNSLNLADKQVKVFKDNEIYRIAVVFYNSIGQASEAKWIADFKAPQGNLEGQYNTLKVTFNSAFYSTINQMPEEQRPTNYSIVRAIRTATDKTIISQGILTGMFVQDYTSDYETTETNIQKAGKNPGLVKTPIIMTRGYGNGVDENNSYYPIFPTGHNKTMNESESELDPGRPGQDQDPENSVPKDKIVDEIYRDDSPDYKRQQSWQYTKMIQMHAPETQFNFQIATTDKDELHLLGYMPRNEFKYWDFNINYETFGPELSTKGPRDLGGTSFYPYLTGGFGIVGPSYRRWKANHSRPEYVGQDTDTPAKFSRRLHVHKTFNPLVRSSDELKYSILNRPEVTNIGQGITAYNNDKGLQYINNLSMVISDAKNPEKSGVTEAWGIKGITSEGDRCLTMVLGDPELDHEDRPGLEDLYSALRTGEWDVELFGEIRKSKEYVYSGAIYGGYNISSRARTEYVAIGEVYDITQYEADIMAPGDTYVQMFKNTRLTRNPASIPVKDSMTIVESLEYLVESTINLMERNDTSLNGWDTVVDPTAEEGTNYNKVYSTDSTIQTFTSDSIKLRNIRIAETEIMASKVKIPGEFVDNWVDFRPNEVQYLDGKYGPITSIINHWNELYAFQDFAIAKIAVSPRVQTQGDDGVSIELGLGKVLHDYQYITTKSGSINKWGVISANSGIYYIDINTKQINRIAKGIEGVSEAKGLHSFLQKNIDRDILEEDNPIKTAGISMGYDVVNGDVFTTVLQGENNYNIAFNEKMNAFTSFYDYKPSRYIVKGERFFTVGPDNNSMWLHNKGDYQTYYDKKYPADITLLINTEYPNVEKVFDTIEYDSEVYLNDLDMPKDTLDTIEAWTTYQVSDETKLVIDRNLKRRFRTWRASIPRQSGSRNRLRDKWLFLKLGFNPDDNKKIILHDIIINYTV